ncbi:hypothetical protein [Acetobacter malorum]|uniref:hypothetical protein n=1 Tax=Acetobacter malorum TaxID=178901 RepID=UPI0039E94984
MKKLTCISLAAATMLTACASDANNASLSPAERQLRQRNAHFNTTLVEGAVVGGLVGAGIGMLAGHNATSAALGGVSGLAAGTGLAYAVASRTQAQQQTEDTYQKAITEAQQSVATATEDAAGSQAIADQANTELSSLDAQYKAHQIDKAQYAQAVQKYSKDATALDGLAQKYGQQAQQMQTYATYRGNDAQMAANAAAMKQKADILKSNEERLVANLSQVPGDVSGQAPAV